MNFIKKGIKILFIVFFLSNTTIKAQDGFLGEIRMFAGNFPPRDWMFCDGQILPIPQNTALFSIIGTIYGGDGRTTFALPDFRSRIAVSAGQGSGLSNYVQGMKGGQEHMTLTLEQMPNHHHYIKLSTEDAIRSIPIQGDVLSTTKYLNGLIPEEVKAYGYSTKEVSGKATSSKGGGQSFNKIQPYNTVRFIICVNGNFPSRG